MDEVVEVLVLAPFREIVIKAKTAAENAQAAAESSGETAAQDGAKAPARAARRLEREGERALLKIEPLCRRHLDTCGQNFIDALKDDGMCVRLAPAVHSKKARTDPLGLPHRRHRRI